MVYQKVETWVLWLIIDLAGTIQYAYLGYWFTAALYALFTLVAIIGWKRWYVLNSN
jgi:nicotinamide mononucleotide transporter